MTTKFLIKSILAISLILIMSSTAGAWTSSTSSSQLFCKSLGTCSIKVEGILKGLGNVTTDPTNFTVSILVQAGAIVIANPGGNTGGIGVPFGDVLVQLTGTDLIGVKDVSKNGSALAEIIFHDADLIAAVVAALQAQCDAGITTSCDKLAQINQKPNWKRAIVVTEMQVLGVQVTNGISVDELGSQCEAPSQVIADPISFVGVAFNYGCTEECHDRTGDPACDGSLPLP